jgi:type II secretory pathway pseudopilin PulG
MSTRLLTNQRGATLMIVLVMVVVMGLAAGLTGSTWKTITQREREAELLFRGEQYRRAIESYYTTTQSGGQGTFPNRLEDLLKDPRSLQSVRHLRKLYLDPMTGEEFEIIRAGGKISGLPGAVQATGGIKGVRSRSTLKPFKQDGFSKVHEKFAGAQEYRQWEFVFEPPQVKAPPKSATPRTPGTPEAPGVPGPPGGAKGN